MVLISGEKVFIEIITWRHKNGFHLSPRGQSVTKMYNLIVTIMPMVLNQRTQNSWKVVAIELF